MAIITSSALAGSTPGGGYACVDVDALVPLPIVCFRGVGKWDRYFGGS